MSKKGSSLIISLLVIAVLATVALGFGRLFVLDSSIARSFEDTQQAYYAAQAGIEEGMRQFIANRNLDQQNVSAPSLPQGQVEKLSVAYKSENPEFTGLAKDSVLELDTSDLESKGAVSIFMFITWQLPGPNAYLQVGRINKLNGSFEQIVCSGTEGTCRIPLVNTGQVRIKPIGSAINKLVVSTQPDSLALDTGVTVISSSGQFRLARRKLEAKVDRKTGTLLSIFDYALLSQQSIQ